MPVGQALVLRGDAAHIPLPDASVDLIVTSPPYWAQRSYTDGGQHYDGQIGSEDTPGAYIDALLDCTREWMRVLKPTGSMFVNLGDKYSSSGGHTDNTASTRLQGRANLRKQERADRTTATHGVPVKSLFGLPWRYAIGCIDQLGLTLRAELIWSKPSALPESVVDRVRRSHEQWFHFTQARKYFAAVDEIRTPPSGYSRDGAAARATAPGQKRRTMEDTCNPLGALPGSVWNIPSEPLVVPAELGIDHFAAFPVAWPKRLILGWSPAGYCTACGEPRQRQFEVVRVEDRKGRTQGRLRDSLMLAHGPDGRSGSRYRTVVAPTGESCGCTQPTASTTPSVVLDPFGGTGTVALVAQAFGRTGISLDRSADYCRLAQWRTADPGQAAKVFGLPKPAPELPGQLDLFHAENHGED